MHVCGPATMSGLELANEIDDDIASTLAFCDACSIPTLTGMESIELVLKPNADTDYGSAHYERDASDDDETNGFGHERHEDAVTECSRNTLADS